jgi:hypothetical protein
MGAYNDLVLYPFDWLLAITGVCIVGIIACLVTELWRQS